MASNRRPAASTRGQRTGITTPTVENLAVRYIDTRRKQQRFRGETPRTVRSVLFNFAEHVGPQLPAVRLTRTHLERWSDSLQLAPNTRKHRISTVRGFCAWMAAEDHIKTDPARSLVAPRLPRSIPRGLDAPSVSTIFSTIPDSRACLIVSLMVQEGLRCKEVAGLEVGDINRAEGQLFVREGKGGHQRVLALSDETLGALRAYLAEAPAVSGPLVRARSTRTPGATVNRPLTPSSISRLVSSWMHDAQVKTAPRDGVSAHALRHTMATDMLKHGAALTDVQFALGHQSIATTQIYLPWTLGDLKTAMGGRTYRTSQAQVGVS